MVTSVVALWTHRQVLRMLVLRDLQRRYTHFRLGYLWTLLEPLGMIFVLWFVFAVLLGTRQLGLQPYLLFLALAIIPWWWFTTGMTMSTKAFRRASGALRISRLPTQLWVARVIIASMAEFILALPVIVVAAVVTRTMPTWALILFPVAMVLQFILMYGLGLLIASVSVVIPDVARFIRIFIRVMFYLSPVLYSVSNIPERVQGLAFLNPLVGIFGLYRVGFFPQETESLLAYVVSAAICVITWAVGAFTFHRLEPRILKAA